MEVFYYHRKSNSNPHRGARLHYRQGLLKAYRENLAKLKQKISQMENTQLQKYRLQRQ